jgi:hypothetical protein
MSYWAGPFHRLHSKWVRVGSYRTQEALNRICLIQVHLRAATRLTSPPTKGMPTSYSAHTFSQNQPWSGQRAKHLDFLLTTGINTRARLPNHKESKMTGSVGKHQPNTAKPKFEFVKHETSVKIRQSHAPNQVKKWTSCPARTTTGRC